MPPPTRVPALLAAVPTSQGSRPSVRHPAQPPQRGRKVMTTRSPGATSVTAFAELLDDARGFMSEQHRRRTHAIAVDDAEVGVADPRRPRCGRAARPARGGSRVRSPTVNGRDCANGGRAGAFEDGSDDLHHDLLARLLCRASLPRRATPGRRPPGSSAGARLRGARRPPGRAETGGGRRRRR